MTGYGYDTAGNMTSNSGASYTYDAENRLTATAGWTYVYNGDGARVKKSSSATNGTVYWTGTSSDALLETDPSGNGIAEYVFFNTKRVARRDVAGGAVHYYLSDHLGSADVIVSSAGAVQEESDYYPYGGEIVITSGDPNHYKFTSKERDTESGLDDFGARYYASGLGRFMTPDWAARPTTIPYAVFGDPQSLNLNGYVRNDPVTLADADGHDPASPPRACELHTDQCASHLPEMLKGKLKNWLKWGHWVSDAGLNAALQTQADQARKNLSGMKGLTLNGQTPGAFAASVNNQEVIAAQRSVMEFLTNRAMRYFPVGEPPPGTQIGVVFPLPEVFAEGPSTLWLDSTAKSALATDITTNITAEAFGGNLEAMGSTKSVAKDGVTALYSKDNQVYSLYPNASSTKGPAANLAVDGVATTKYRLQRE